MKYIIEIDSKVIEDAKNGYVRLGEIADAVKTTATPYNPSGDAISREALKEQINATDFDFGDYYDNTEEIRKRVCEAIDNAQAIEHSLLPLAGEADNAYMRGYEVGKAEGILKASTRPQGEWIIIKSPLSNETIVKCDKCGDEFIGNDVEDYNFCPICGADMKGDKK